MLPRGINVKVLNRLVEDMKKSGLIAERHSYSIRIMYRSHIVASIHLYPGYDNAVVKLYGDEEANRVVLETTVELLKKHLPGFKVEFQVITH
jgi:hypothetical protein